MQEVLDPGAHRALEMPGVRALEADRDVGDREDAVQVDEHRDQALVALGVPEHAVEEAGLAVLPRRVEPHVVAADRFREQLGGLGVTIEDVLRGDRARVDEGVDVRDHRMAPSYHVVCTRNTLCMRQSYEPVWQTHT